MGGKWYQQEIIQTVRFLRKQGKTYGEIRKYLDREIPKSTLSDWCKHVLLPPGYQEEIAKLNFRNLSKARQVSLGIRRAKRKEFFELITEVNSPIAERINDKEVAKIALAMLCLGEASKYNPKTTAGFNLGSSDCRIVTLFLRLLKQCFDFDMEKLRCTVQCRADQDPEALKDYWVAVTGVDRKLFLSST